MKKEMKLSIILLLIGIILLSPSFVHAETLNVSENSKFNNTNIPVWYEISPYRNILFSYEDWRLYSGDPNNANFGYIDICIYGGVTVNNNNADCSDGCLNNINLYDTGISCKIEYPNQVNANGRRYFIFFNIKKWGMKNSDTLPYFQDYLTFARTTGYDPIIDFNMVFLSNEDLYVQYANNNKIQELIEQSNQAMNDSINDMKDMDIGSEDKEVPSDDKYQDYEEQEQILKDSMEQADLNDLDIAIDVPTSDFIWQTITRLINSNSLVFGMFIAILSIGIIKLAFGR